MSQSAPSLQAQIESLHKRYRSGFAGKSRATRDLALLDGILEEAHALRVKVGDGTPLAATLSERVGLYESERNAIAEVQAGGPELAEGLRLIDWSWLTMQRYLRQFAGQSRGTRDLGLLRRMVTEQRGWRDRLEQLAARSESGFLAEPRVTVQRNLEIFETELVEIPKARAGLPPGERWQHQASAANVLFNSYALHFANKSRPTRRPALLRSMIDALRGLLREMEEVRDAGQRSAAHLDNIQKVGARIRHHETELEQIGRAIANTLPSQRISLLAEEANALFASYREAFAGKSRETRDRAKLDKICEELHELARTMADLDGELGNEINRGNLEVVVESLKTYEREYRRIAEAQAPRA